MYLMKMQIRFYFKKNSNPHLMKMLIRFIMRKFISTSNEDANLFFYFEKNSDLHLRKMQICFYFEKNSDLHLRKMQIYFLVLRKRVDCMQIFEIKKEIITIIKDSRSCFK